MSLNDAVPYHNMWLVESAYLPSMENNIMAGTANLAVMIVEIALMVQHQ